MLRPWPLLLLLATLAACGATTAGPNLPRDFSARPTDGGPVLPEDDGGAAIDQGIPGPDLAFAGCDDQHPCPQGRRCYQDQCIPDHGTCRNDDECQNDTYCLCALGGGGDAGACMGGICVPYGVGPRGLFDPDCQIQGFSAAQFENPKLKCKWDNGGQSSSGTLVTPIVADLDGDKKPEIVFESYPNQFTAIHGADCSLYFRKTFSFAESNQSQLAVADLDADGKPEIIGVSAAHRVVVFDHQGNLLATAPAAYVFSGGPQDWGGPAIVDVDNQAPPEIVVAGQVSRYQNKQLQVLWTKSILAPQFGPLSIAADLDGDKRPEVIAGKSIFDGVTGADETPPNLAALGGVGAFPAIGDFNGDKKPDLVLVQAAKGQERVSIYDFTNKQFLFGPYDVPGGWGGPPTVADFDGDGQPEFGTAAPDRYYVFDVECTKNPKPKKCDPNSNIGVLWQKATQDKSSGGTASSVFDFNGDGRAEVVYRDECWLRVYNGLDGKALFAANVTSATALELPVVADVDNDGHADVVVTSDSYAPGLCPKNAEAETGAPWVGQSFGVYVFQDPKNRWMPSRSLWNQHSYHITNVQDDLTIPTVEKENWTSWNNYRQNVQGMIATKPNPQADLTGGVATGIDNAMDDCVNGWTLRANVCNRGTAQVPAGLPGAFYSSDPRNGNPMPLCTVKTTQALDPGKCETVSCVWKKPAQGPTDLWFRSADDGRGMAPAMECKSRNNILFLPKAECQKIG